MSGRDLGIFLAQSDRDPRRRLVLQVAWFNRLRFVAVAGMALATFVASSVFEIVGDPVPLYVMCACTLAVNLAYRAWYPRLGTLRSVQRHVALQIGVDLSILTLVLHFSGGITNPFVVFYTFHTFIASLLLTRRVAIVVAIVSGLLIAGLGLSEYAGLVAHRPIALGLLPRDDLATLVAWICGLVSLLAGTIYFVGAILARLRASERELLGLTRQLALSEKLASIGTLAAGVSHEINNPVGVIANKTEILRYRIADGDPAAALLAEIDTIDKHVGRVRGITEGLLAFSRETPFELRTIEVGKLVREAADLVKVPFERAGIELEVVQPAAPARIRGSSNHLLQVLVNVLLNARDASPAGSAVRIAVLGDPDEVTIEITDRGEGIASENLDKIFDPFFTTKEVDKGTGLGLALSHGLVERHGGRIVVESEVGVGSRFAICLPRVV